MAQSKEAGKAFKIQGGISTESESEDEMLLHLIPGAKGAKDKQPTQCM